MSIQKRVDEYLQRVEKEAESIPDDFAPSENYLSLIIGVQGLRVSDYGVLDAEYAAMTYRNCEYCNHSNAVMKRGGCSACGAPLWYDRLLAKTIERRGY